MIFLICSFACCSLRMICFFSSFAFVIALLSVAIASRIVIFCCKISLMSFEVAFLDSTSWFFCAWCCFFVSYSWLSVWISSSFWETRALFEVICVSSSRSLSLPLSMEFLSCARFVFMLYSLVSVCLIFERFHVFEVISVMIGICVRTPLIFLSLHQKRWCKILRLLCFAGYPQG